MIQSLYCLKYILIVGSPTTDLSSPILKQKKVGKVNIVSTWGKFIF